MFWQRGCHRHGVFQIQGIQAQHANAIFRLRCWTCIPLIWGWHLGAETCRRLMLVIHCILFIAFVGWRTGLIIRIGTAWITKDSNCFGFEYNSGPLLVCQAVRHCGMASMCGSGLEATFSNCTLHRSWSLRLRTWQHACWSCALLTLEKTVRWTFREFLWVKGHVPFIDPRLINSWKPFSLVYAAKYSPQMRGKRIVALCFLRVPELMDWIFVRTFAVLVAFLYSSLQGKYNVVPDLHQFISRNSPLNADGRIGKYRYAK